MTRMMILGSVLLAAGAGTGAMWMYGGRPQVFVTEVEIAAPAEVVFAHLTEPEKLKLWIDGLQETRLLTEGGLRPGARSLEVVEKEGHRVDIETEVTHVEPGKLLQMDMRCPFFSAVIRQELAPGTGATRLRQSFTVEYHGILRLFAPFGRERTERDLKSDFLRLKQAAEGVARGSAPSA